MFLNEEEYLSITETIQESQCSKCTIDYYYKPPLTNIFCYDCDPRNKDPTNQSKNFEHEDKLLAYTHSNEIVPPIKKNGVIDSFSRSSKKKYFNQLMTQEYRSSDSFKAWQKEYMIDYRKSSSFVDWHYRYRKKYSMENKAEIKLWRQFYRRNSIHYKEWRKNYRNSQSQRLKELAYKREYNSRPVVMERNRLYQVCFRAKKKLLSE